MKDYQQLTLIRSMAVDLDLDVDIVGCRPRANPRRPGAFEPQRLPVDRAAQQAAAIPRALQAAAHETDADTIAAVAGRNIWRVLDVDYAVVRSSQMGPVQPVRADCWSLRASDRPACSTIAR